MNSVFKRKAGFAALTRSRNGMNEFQTFFRLTRNNPYTLLELLN
jgi:hypothetical protein